MINFKQLSDGMIVATQDQHDGGTHIIAKCDKMNAVAKIAVAQALAIAFIQLNHTAVICDLFRNHADTLAKKD